MCGSGGGAYPMGKGDGVDIIKRVAILGFPVDRAVVLCKAKLVLG